MLEAQDFGLDVSWERMGVWDEKRRSFDALENIRWMIKESLDQV